ncbi:hypothetical protein, partial [Caballeronia glebae]|uniref:hypothetical protein n=1 Tax=Caballeronia glebae TaxID=1777143 RepID=UPI001F2D7A79
RRNNEKVNSIHRGLTALSFILLRALSQLSFCRTHLADTFKSFFADVISPPFLAICSVAVAQTAQQRDAAAPPVFSSADCRLVESLDVRRLSGRCWIGVSF